MDWPSLRVEISGQTLQAAIPYKFANMACNLKNISATVEQDLKCATLPRTHKLYIIVDQSRPNDSTKLRSIPGKCKAYDLICVILILYYIDYIFSIFVFSPHNPSKTHITSISKPFMVSFMIYSKAIFNRWTRQCSFVYITRIFFDDITLKLDLWWSMELNEISKLML